MSCARSMKAIAYAMILLGCVVPARSAQAPADNDQTLRAMRDEMARSKTRLELNIPGTQQPVRPYYVEYRLLDLDVRAVTASFGSLVSNTTDRVRYTTIYKSYMIHTFRFLFSCAA